MKTGLDTHADAAQGDTDQQDRADYADLLDESESLGIEDPNETDPEEAAADDAAEDDPDEGEDEGRPDGQDAKSVSDEATVKMDGRDVSVRELKETFSTFRRKTQEYAEADQAREVQARTAIADIQEEAAQRVALLAQGVNDLVLPGIDLQAIARIRHEDPARAGELLTTLQIVEQWKNTVMSKAQELWQQAQQQRQLAGNKQQKAQAELLAQESEKLSGAKWFNDAFKSQAQAFVKAHGIPSQFANQATSYAGGVEILRKAMLYDAAQKKLKAGKQPSQQTHVPASAKAREATSKQRADAAFQTARKTGSRRDTARAYTSLLGG